MPKSYYPDRVCACGCNGKIEVKKSHSWCGIPKYIYNHHKKGKKQSKEVIEKRIAPLRGSKRTVEQKQNISKSLKNKPKSIEHRNRLSEVSKGKKKPKLSFVMKGKVPWNKGLIMHDRLGDKNPNWKGGVSCEPYCFQWSSKEYKEFIKNRDGKKCLNPECDGKTRKICLHHINYIKKDCEQSNLITLCLKCNSKANFDREWHQNWYKAIIKKRYSI